MVTMTESKRRRNLLFAALGYLIKKDFDRDELSPGSVNVQGQIDATVGRAKVEVPFAGELHVGEDQESASSSSADQAHVIAVILGKLPESHRVRLLEQLPREFERDLALPPVDTAELAAVHHMLKRLRSKTTKTRRGNVVFHASSAE